MSATNTKVSEKAKRLLASPTVTQVFEMEKRGTTHLIDILRGQVDHSETGEALDVGLGAELLDCLDSIIDVSIIRGKTWVIGRSTGQVTLVLSFAPFAMMSARKVSVMFKERNLTGRRSVMWCTCCRRAGF